MKTLNTPLAAPPQASARPIIGIDVGGTKCAVLHGSTDGRILHKLTFPTETAKGLEHTLQNLWKAMEQVVAQSGGGEPVFGVSCGGPMNSREGLVLSPPNLPGWDHVPIIRLIKERFGGQAFLMNDANAGALAEWKWGAARGTEDAIFLTFGTGMGSGIQAAWEKGAKVSFCADEMARTQLELKTVAEAARKGDALARGVFETSAFYLGRGLAILIDILNPEVIVIGSVFARCEDLLRPTAMRVLAEEALPPAVQRCRIVPAGLGEAIGDYAALAIAYAGLSGELGDG